MIFNQWLALVFIEQSVRMRELGYGDLNGLVLLWRDDLDSFSLING